MNTLKLVAIHVDRSAGESLCAYPGGPLSYTKENSHRPTSAMLASGRASEAATEHSGVGGTGCGGRRGILLLVTSGET